MFIPLAFFLLVVVGVVLFFVLAGKKKAEGEDLGIMRLIQTMSRLIKKTRHKKAAIMTAA